MSQHDYENKLPPVGMWPLCRVGKYYKVLHERHKGRVGLAIETSETGFGHRGVRLKFDDNDEVSFRTHDVTEVSAEEYSGPSASA